MNSVSRVGWLVAGSLCMLGGVAVAQDGPQAEPPQAASASPSLPENVFLEAWRVARVAFYDPGMNGVDWDGVREELLPRARAARDGAELSAVINDALGRLGASHTGHYHRDQREYYELLDVFFPGGVPEREGSAITPGPVGYAGVGLAAVKIDGRTFAADVYAGGPAEKAGILAGDELVSVEGAPWSDVAAFRGREGVATRVVVQRTPNAASRMEVGVVPERIRPRELFLAGIKAGARIIEHGGKRIAYIRVVSYAHPDYHEAVRELVQGELAGADGLVLDLRGGWGGANPGYLDIFNPVVPELRSRDRDGEARVYSAAWRKPAVMLVDGGTRSGKEVLAYAFKKHKIGRIVGERTAGAVLAGTPRPLADGSVLYIAVADVGVDGERIEGRGVEPDVAVARELPYSAGRDPQVEAAVRAAAGE